MHFTFEYHLNLHYSQTLTLLWKIIIWFEYHLNLHYSQTTYEQEKKNQEFEYHLNLHYSQTLFLPQRLRFQVWVPSEFTLLSNTCLSFIIIPHVWVPSEFTLLSNGNKATYTRYKFEYHLNLHYSQTEVSRNSRTVRFEYHLNLHYSQTAHS